MASLNVVGSIKWHTGMSGCLLILHGRDLASNWHNILIDFQVARLWIVRYRCSFHQLCHLGLIISL